MNDETPLKRCPKCSEEKPATTQYFYRCTKAWDGLYGYCKDCSKIIRKNYREEHLEEEKASFKQYYQDNADWMKQRTKDYYQEHIEEKRATRKQYYQDNLEQERAYRKRRYKEKRDVILAASRQGRFNNPDKKRVQLNDWRRRNPIRVKIAYHEQRTRRQNLPYDFTDSDWLYALTYWNNCCAICGRYEGEDCCIASDHWIPLSYPGDNNPGTVPWNIVPLCHGKNGCNNKKKNKLPNDWLWETFEGNQAHQKLTEIEKFFQSAKTRERNSN